MQPGDVRFVNLTELYV